MFAQDNLAASVTNILLQCRVYVVQRPGGGGFFLYKLELMFMKHYAPNRCLYIKVAKLRTGVGSAEMSHLQNRCLKISG